MVLLTKYEYFYSHEGQDHINGVIDNHVNAYIPPKQHLNDFGNLVVSAGTLEDCAVIHMHWHNFYAAARTSLPVKASSNGLLSRDAVYYEEYHVLLPLEDSKACERRYFKYGDGRIIRGDRGNFVLEKPAFPGPTEIPITMDMTNLSLDGASAYAGGPTPPRVNTLIPFFPNFSLCFPVRRTLPGNQQFDNTLGSDSAFVRSITADETLVDMDGNHPFPNIDDDPLLVNSTPSVRRDPTIFSERIAIVRDLGFLSLDDIGPFADAVDVTMDGSGPVTFGLIITMDQGIRYGDIPGTYTFIQPPPPPPSLYYAGHVTRDGEGNTIEKITRDVPYKRGRATLLTGEDLFIDTNPQFLLDLLFMDRQTPPTMDYIDVTVDLLFKDVITLFDKQIVAPPLLVDPSGDLDIEEWSTVTLNGVDRGYLPTRFLDHTMTQTDLYTIGVGLLYAVDMCDFDLVANITCELIWWAKNQRSLIETEDGLQLDQTVEVGFPHSFSIEATFNNPRCNDPKQVWSNAWLGYCLCVAYNCMTENRPHLWKYKYYGGIPNILNNTKELLRFLAYTCALAVSPISRWAAGQLQTSGFTYDAVSVRASCMVSMFLGEALEIEYDYFVHGQALLLYRAVKESSIDYASLFYDYFTLEAEIDGSPSTDDQQLRDESVLTRITFRLLWAIKYDVPEVCDQLISDYEAARASYITTYTQDPPQEEFLHVFVLHLARDVYGKTLTMPAWAEISTYYAPYDLGNPYLEGGMPIYPDFHPEAFSRLTCSRFRLFKAPNFELMAYEASLHSNIYFQELLRMWPFGCRWNTPEVEETIGSNLGSIMYGYSYQYLPFTAAYQIARQSIDLTLAEGFALDNWTPTVFPRRGLMPDHEFRSWLHDFQTRDKDTTEAIAEGLSELFEYQANITVFPGLLPYDYKTEPINPEVLLSYDVNMQSLEGKFLNKNEYLTFVYRSVTTITADQIDVTMDQLQLPKYVPPRLVDRTIPGFTYRYYEAGGVETSVDEVDIDIAINPTSDPYNEGYTYDRPVLIRPFTDVLARLLIELRGPVKDYLDYFFETTVPAGVEVQARATAAYLWDDRDKFDVRPEDDDIIITLDPAAGPLLQTYNLCAEPPFCFRFEDFDGQVIWSATGPGTPVFGPPNLKTTIDFVPVGGEYEICATFPNGSQGCITVIVNAHPSIFNVTATPPTAGSPYSSDLLVEATDDGLLNPTLVYGWTIAQHGETAASVEHGGDFFYTMTFIISFNQPPVITSIFAFGSPFYEDKLLALDVEATDPDSFPVTPLQYGWTLQQYDEQVFNVEHGGDFFYVMTFTVIPNLPPEITAIGATPPSPYEDQVTTLDVTGSDPDNRPITPLEWGWTIEQYEDNVFTEDHEGSFFYTMTFTTSPANQPPSASVTANPTDPYEDEVTILDLTAVDPFPAGPLALTFGWTIEQYGTQSFTEDHPGDFFYTMTFNINTGGS